GIDLCKDAQGVHSFSTTRNLAERDRGFSRISWSLGVIGLRVITRTDRRWPQIQTGAWGGHTQSVASTWNRFFAILSSRERKATTATRPPGACTAIAAFNPPSIDSG